LAETLERAFLLEARLLEASIDHYAESRQSEYEAFDAFEKVSRRMDEQLADDAVPVLQLRRLEAELSASREVALATARDAAAQRRELYARMDRLDALGDELERERAGGAARTPASAASPQPAPAEPPGVEGVWRFEVDSIDEFGIVRLRRNGTDLSGTFRLSNGNQGALRGTLVGDRVHLERIDETRTVDDRLNRPGGGYDATLDGVLDAEAGEIRGTWSTRELAVGRPSSAEFVATRMSSVDDDVAP
jgi:hypothetical protein